MKPHFIAASEAYADEDAEVRVTFGDLDATENPKVAR